MAVINVAGLRDDTFDVLSFCSAMGRLMPTLFPKGGLLVPGIQSKYGFPENPGFNSFFGKLLLVGSGFSRTW